MEFDSSISALKGVGVKRSQQLQRLGLCSLFDVLTYFPRDYEDQSRMSSLDALQPGEKALVSGIIQGLQEKKAFRRGMSILTAIISDGTGFLQLTWFNQKFLKRQLETGKRILAYGKIAYAYGGRGQLCMNQISSWEILEGEANIASRCGILPIYAASESVNQKLLRSLTRQVTELIVSGEPDGQANASDKIYAAGKTEKLIIPEVISLSLRQEFNLLDRVEAFKQVHYPDSSEMCRQARYRLAFEELYLIQCGLLLLKKYTRVTHKGIAYQGNGTLVNTLLQQLPFQLTADQQTVWQDICRDMEQPVPMRRLLQGDVGSGKTVVAMLALVKAVENGYQGALMAPTEILARQHYEGFQAQLAPLGIKVALLSGKMAKKQREEVYAALAEHKIDILIGTHALIQEQVAFARLGLAITDEQHRFGINQRALLEGKSNVLPDVLVMTATPIPRTLTLTVYGDLDVSSIHQLPPGRKPIRTFVRGKERRSLIYKFVLEEIKKGRQAYVVCPLIENSDNSSLTSVEEVYQELSRGIFAGVPCSMLHGKMKQKEKEELMQQFYAGEIKLLVSTTVIEVGVNVPNASIMVVEQAQQFGLAQLHQLRGRIGRGEYASYCILVSEEKTEEAKARMHIMETTSDGFVLAEEDLKLRGPGQFFGAHQSGLPDLKMANAEQDIDILLQARKAALASIDKQEYMQYVLPALKLQYRDQFLHILDN